MHNGTYDVAVMVIFLFQMVFMDTALTIVTGSAAERWKYAAFLVSSFLMGAFTYPMFANWAWGGGWLATLGINFGLGHGYCGLRRLGRGARGRRRDGAGDGHHHRAAHRQVRPRRQGQRDSRPRHRARADSAASSWPSAGSASTRARRWARPATATCASAPIAVNTMLAGMAGSFGAMFYMWIRYGKPDASMSGNGLLAGLVAITAPSGFVNPVGSVIIGFIAGVLVCLVGRIRRARAEGGRSGRRDLGARRQRHLGRHRGRPVRRRQEQLRRLLERRHRLGDRACSTAMPASWWRSSSVSRRSSASSSR